MPAEEHVLVMMSATLRLRKRRKVGSESYNKVRSVRKGCHFFYNGGER